MTQQLFKVNDYVQIFVGMQLNKITEESKQED